MAKVSPEPNNHEEASEMNARNNEPKATHATNAGRTAIGFDSGAQKQNHGSGPQGCYLDGLTISIASLLRL